MKLKKVEKDVDIKVFEGDFFVNLGMKVFIDYKFGFDFG